jgi:hypothetical protein
MESYHNQYSSHSNSHNNFPQSSIASSSSSARYRPPANPVYHPPSLYPLHSTSSASSVSYPPRPPPAQRLPSNMDGLLDNTDTEISAAAPLTTDPNFDIIDWHPAYQSCQRYFLDHAQHEPGTQALCALINIRLPFQWLSNPIQSSTPPSINTAPSSAHSNSQFTFTPNSYQRTNGHHSNDQSSHLQTQSAAGGGAVFISLLPYLRRLIITGFDKAPILHGFFGDRYKAGIAPHLDCERRNFLFTAKHGGWRTCKKFYDAGSSGGGDETAPFMKPLEDASAEELEAAERAWSKWLAMEDWMVGERSLGEDAAPGGSQGSGSGSGKERSR